MPFRLICTAALVLLVGAAQAADLPGPVERASPDDCAIFVAVGKAQLNWGAAPPGYDFFPALDGKDGGTYLEECPWKQLGVADPVIGSPASTSGFYFMRPVYSGDEATMDYSVSMRPPAGQQGRVFLEDQSCTLTKSGGEWRVVSCQMTIIT
ncbi:MAG TPA: hypothetical protein VGG48_18710 [Rhizomicrobium sp.]|jgi:hypothetical protein